MKKVIIVSMALLLVGMVIWALKAAPEENSRDANNSTASEVDKTKLADQPTTGVYRKLSSDANEWLKGFLGHKPYSKKLAMLGKPDQRELNLPADGEWSDWLDLYGYDYSFTNLRNGVEFVLLDHAGKQTRYVVKGMNVFRVENGSFVQVELGPNSYGLNVAVKARRGSSINETLDVTVTYMKNERTLTFNPEEIVVTQ